MLRDISYFDDGLDAHDDTHYRRCVALWNAVLLQAFTDMASKTTIPDLIDAKHRAAHWLTAPSAGLSLVCDFAGRSADAVRVRASRIGVGNGLNLKAAPQQAQDYEKRKEYRMKYDIKRQVRKRYSVPRMTLIPDITLSSYHIEILA